MKSVKEAVNGEPKLISEALGSLSDSSTIGLGTCASLATADILWELDGNSLGTYRVLAYPHEGPEIARRLVHQSYS